MLVHALKPCVGWAWDVWWYRALMEFVIDWERWTGKGYKLVVLRGGDLRRKREEQGLSWEEGL